MVLTFYHKLLIFSIWNRLKLILSHFIDFGEWFTCEVKKLRKNDFGGSEKKKDNAFGSPCLSVPILLCFHTDSINYSKILESIQLRWVNLIFFDTIRLPRSMDKIHGIGELVAPSSLNFYKNRVIYFIDNITAL